MTQRNSGPPGRLRIVGGEWRGRRLSVLDQPGLRPTPDRVRETLFNWLAPLIKGAWCLDLFAGTGALGFEAASRGADRVVMIEKLANVVRVLHENRLLLDARQIEVIHADASPWLAGQAEPFNLVFLDPPFAEDLLDTLNQTVIRQQRQLDSLQEQFRLLHQQVRDSQSDAEPATPREEIPPHY